MLTGQHRGAGRGAPTGEEVGQILEDSKPGGAQDSGTQHDQIHAAWTRGEARGLEA